MKKSWLFITGFFCLLALLSSCQDDMALDRPGNDAEKPMNAIFELNLVLDQPTHSRTATDSTPGNDMERQLNRLYLFAVPCTEQNGNIQEDWTRASWGAAQVPQNWQNPIRVPISLVSNGKLRVYVGANLSDAQARAFVSEQAYTIQNKQTYYESINEFAPFYRRSDGKASYYRNPENIAMFCREPGMVDTTVEPQKTEEEQKVYKVGTIYLQRMVAKVLVTCETKKNDTNQGDVSGIDYVTLKGDLSTSKSQMPQGWIRQKNVYYFINNMPRKAKFMLRYEDTDNDNVPELQAHYNLKETFKELISSELPLIFKEDKIKEHFIHYDLLNLYKYEQSFKPSEVWNQEDYDDLLHTPTRTDNPYNQKGVGMYTLENLFDLKIASGAATDQEFDEAEMEILWHYQALPIITQVSIAAKFVPRYIYLTEEEWKGSEGEVGIKDESLTIDGEIKTLKDWVTPEIAPGEPGYLYASCPNEAVAQKILTASIKRMNKSENPYDPQKPDRFPDDTFFAYTRAESIGGGTVYCTYGVATSFGTKGEVDKTMIPYTNGWGYYYTYINSQDSEAITKPEQLKDTYILRNTYYILKVTGITQLGSTITDDNYIKVHTLKAAWQDGGSGDITLH